MATAATALTTRTEGCDLWNVAIFAEEDESLNKTFRLPPSTTISKLTQIWKDANKMFGRWLLESASEELIYKEWMTLEMIGLTIPRSKILNLIAKLSDETIPRPVNDIYLYINDKCHHIKVNPQEKIIDVLRRLTVKSKVFIYNGAPLDLEHTVEQAGLENNSCIYETMSKITVKLSSGYSRTMHLPSDSTVLHLVEKVNKYEMGAFSLVYRGRHLDSHDRIADLKGGLVEVSTGQFDVHFNDQKVTWTTGTRPIPFAEFVSRLQFEGNINAKSLHAVKFYCTGCGRCVCESDGDPQILPIDCCRVKSMKLTATSPTEPEALSNQNEVVSYIMSLCEHGLESEMKDPRTAVSRDVYKTRKEKFERLQLNYNLITKCDEKIKRKISELEEKIRAFEIQIETLKTEVAESKEEVETLKTEVAESKEEVETLKTEVAESKEEVETLKTEVAESKEEVETLKTEVAESKEEVETLKTEVAESKEEVETLRITNLEYVEKIQILTEENRRLANPQGATAAGPSRVPVADLGEELMVRYRPEDFSPVSRPDVQQGQYPGHRPYIKCRVPGIVPGLVRFEDLRDALSPFFNAFDGEIQVIYQLRGAVAGTAVAQVTSREDEWEKDLDRRPFCTAAGEEHSWREAGKPGMWQVIQVGGSVLVCSGRRTVLIIES